jgi:hypothetical protein
MSETFHACFISYRHPCDAGNREAKIIEQVIKAISDHIQMYTHEHKVFFDKQRLVPGYQYDERLAEAICRSACMVIVYWPAYLESAYCRKEMEAMLEIERRRRAVLGDALHGCRLFIPFILRGDCDHLPAEIREGCQYLDYKKQATNPNVNLGDDEDTSERLYNIAEYIKSLCDKMRPNSQKLFENCKQYGFPTASSSETTNTNPAAPPQPFPGR